MKRLRGMALALGLAAVCLGAVLPAYAASGSRDVQNIPSTVNAEIDSLLSPEVLRSLNLTRNQRDSLDELRRRDWGDRRDDRRDDNRFDRRDGRDFDRFRGLFDLGHRGGGYGVRIERDNDDLQTFLAILALGLYMSDAGDRYVDDYYSMMRLDDFLYLFFRILDMNQRQTFTIHFDRWYDNRYIYRRDDRRFNDWDRWGFPRDWDRRLKLDDRQRRDMERTFRDMDDRYRDKERHYREMEKDYFKRSWDDRSGRDREEQRRKLFEARKDFRIPEREIRERVRPILKEPQRKMFDSMFENKGPAPWQQKNSDGPVIRKPMKNDH